MSESTLPEVKIDTIVSLMTEHVPYMEKVSQEWIEELKQIQSIPEDDEDEYEFVKGTLANARDAYNAINSRRTTITGPLDDLKKRLMDYERPLSDSDKSSEYNRVRNLLSAFEQAKIDKKKKLEAAAAKKKERENDLVDIGATVLTKLNDMLLAEVKNADTLSDAYFKATTLDDWDERIKRYNAMKPTLKEEKYLKCFDVFYRADFWTPVEFKDIIDTLKKQETLEKWTALVIEKATPVINEWRAKISELKQNLINLKNAGDESERQRIAAEQETKARQEKERRDRELEQQHLDQNQSISVQANLSKLENSFVEQATVQQGGDTGPVKLVLKFNDPKKTLKALTTIMYNCMAHPEFPGIEKRDKNKKLVMDESGKPEYIDAVQWWINFFLAKCDVAVEGTEVNEKAKTIIRK